MCEPNCLSRATSPSLYSTEHGNKLATKDLEVSVFVGEVFDGVRDDAEAHAREVGRSDFKDSMGERLPLLVDLFHRHRAHDGALVALQSLLGN